MRWWLGWLSATITRQVYPPPHRGEAPSDPKWDGSAGKPLICYGVGLACSGRNTRAAQIDGNVLVRARRSRISDWRNA
jgi:hypothetical protein